MLCKTLPLCHIFSIATSLRSLCTGTRSDTIIYISCCRACDRNQSFPVSLPFPTPMYTIRPIYIDSWYSSLFPPGLQNLLPLFFKEPIYNRLQLGWIVSLFKTGPPIAFYTPANLAGITYASVNVQLCRLQILKFVSPKVTFEIFIFYNAFLYIASLGPKSIIGKVSKLYLPYKVFYPYYANKLNSTPSFNMSNFLTKFHPNWKLQLVSGRVKMCVLVHSNSRWTCVKQPSQTKGEVNVPGNPPTDFSSSELFCVNHK
jgi:hypothetical protein